jgi:hypothetical protein
MEEQKAKVFETLEELRTGCAAFDELAKNEAERVSHESLFPIHIYTQIT